MAWLTKELLKVPTAYEVSVDEVTCPAAEVFTPTDKLFLGIGANPIDISIVATTGMFYSDEKAVRLSTETKDLYNIRPWITYPKIPGVSIRAVTTDEIKAAPDPAELTGGGEKAAADTAIGEFPNATGIMPIFEGARHLAAELTWLTPTKESHRIVLCIQVDESKYTDFAYESDAVGGLSEDFIREIATLMFYLERSEYKQHPNWSPSYYTKIFGELPAVDIGIIENGIIRSLGYLEPGVAYSNAVTTVDNKIGYPKNTVQLVMTEKDHSMTATVSTATPWLWSLINQYPMTYDATTKNYKVDVTDNTPILPEYPLVLRGFYKGSQLMEMVFNSCVITPNGDITRHQEATRMPITITPLPDLEGNVGTMYISSSPVDVIGIPITTQIKTT